MKKYPKYKDSGIEWIGEIPEHWEVWKLSHAFTEIGSGTTPTSGEKKYHENGTINWLNTGDLNDGYLSSCKKKVTELAVEDFSALKLFPANSLVIAMYGATIGKVSLLDFETTVNQACCVLAKSEIISKRFLFYWLLANKQEIINLAKGGGQPNISQDIIKSLKVPTSNDETEQESIATYLDKKTAEIDDLIKKKEHLITLYKEERTATINQAVTKGLNPNVPMKDSGIEWLGEIPEHWEVKRVDWVTDIVRGNSAFKRDELLDSGKYIALQYGKTYKVDVVDESFNFFVNDEFYKENQVVSRGDTILISTSETVEDLGHTCYYDNGNIGLIGGEQIVLKPNREALDEKYLYYYTIQLGTLLRKYAKGLKVYRFNTNDLKQQFFAIPPKEEQETISTFLSKKSIELDTLTFKAEQEIELLKEYKTALISEVVIGKVDVRESILTE